MSNRDYLYSQDENYNIYKLLMDSITKRIRQVQIIVRNNNLKHKDETEILKTLVNYATYESKGDNWSYYIPNIRLASQKLNEVDDAIEDFFKTIDREIPEQLKRKDFYEKYLPRNSYSSNHLKYNLSEGSSRGEKSILKQFTKNKEFFSRGYRTEADYSLIYDDESIPSNPIDRLKQLLDKVNELKDEKIAHEVIESAKNSLQRFNMLSAEEKKNFDKLYELDNHSNKLEEIIERTNQKSINDKSKNMKTAFEISFSNKNISNIITKTTQTYQRPLHQTETVETFTINFPTQLNGRNNGKTLPPLEGYGSTAVLGTIGGTNIGSLSGVSGEHSLPYTQFLNTTSLGGFEGKSSESAIKHNAGKDSESNNISGQSEVVTESHTIDIDYKVDSFTGGPSDASKETVKQDVPTFKEEVTPQVDVIENQFSDYRKKEADRIMTDYTEMRNSLHFYDWDAKVTDLVQKGNTAFKVLEDALSNSKKVTEQELIFATDRLDVLYYNLKKRKEELGYQELNKLHNAISDYNEAYNTLYSKVYYLDEQYFDEYHQASEEGRAITQYFDRLLSEGEIDYTNIFESESVKTELARLEGFTTALTRLTQTITE